MTFKPGQSGNPSGRPKIPQEVIDLARAHTAQSVQALVEVMQNKRSPAAARVNAAATILDRGWGKAKQPVEVDAARNVADFIASLGVGAATAHNDSVAEQPEGVRH